MRRARGLFALLALLFVASAGCSLLVDTDDIVAGCGPGQKLCGEGNCVAIDDPAYGCDPLRCEPCLLVNARARCDGEACAVKACLFGFGCPTAKGCETFVRVDRNNCGVCGNACVAGQSCQNGVCVEP